MQADAYRLLAQFPDIKTLVLGDAILNRSLGGTTCQADRETPEPVGALANRNDSPGGAANDALNIHSLGSPTTFVSVLGDDLEGELLAGLLWKAGVNVDHVVFAPGRQTLAKQRIAAASETLLRLDQGTTEPLDLQSETAMLERLEALYPEHDVIVLSDHGHGLFTKRIIDAIGTLQARHRRLLVVDSRNRFEAFSGTGATLAKPNYQETLSLLGLPRTEEAADRAGIVLEQRERILTCTGCKIAAVTLGAGGAVILERGRPPLRSYTSPAPAARAHGASGAYLSAFALALAAGASTELAAEMGQAAADVVIGKDGAASCSADELAERWRAGEMLWTDVEQLVHRVESHRQQGRRIVFTNGCFDTLHAGHISFLKQARTLGEVLIVGVRSDASVRRLKGPDRPINTLKDRIKALAELGCIDHLIAIEEDTSIHLIRALRPDVLVKGDSDSRDRLPEANAVEAVGGSIRFLPRVAERPTSGITNRVRMIVAPAALGNDPTFFPRVSIQPGHAC